MGTALERQVIKVMTDQGSGVQNRTLFAPAAILLGIAFLMTGCAGTTETAQTPTDSAVSAPCPQTEAMKSCSEKLTNIFLRTDKTYKRLSARSPGQTDALHAMKEASEYWAAKCHDLSMTVGSRDNPLGCRDAMMKIAESAVFIDPTIDD